ncbi:MAG: nucleotidyltransferase domain-containing protein [Flavobacteriales bacterium]|nr:nucleotidyltransferase domain-containing protein [Flavobacteriales bacterium]
MLDLAPEHLRIVRGLLAEHLPGCRALAFGSRVKGTARRFSDLDIAVEGGTAIPWSTLGQLKEALSESDLPMRVDVVDLTSASKEFRAMVLSHALPLNV